MGRVVKALALLKKSWKSLIDDKIIQPAPFHTPSEQKLDIENVINTVLMFHPNNYLD